LFTMKKVAAAAAGVVLAGTMSGVAFGYWTNSGSGSGSAATGTNTAITINQTSTVAGLYPGGPAQGLSGTFTNPNTSKVFVEAVSATGVTVDAGHASCLASDYVVGGTAVVHGEIDPGTGGAWTGLTIAMKDTTGNQDGCKGAALTIAYTSN
jgi:hypothetical protein